ncbi:hypothetical protein DL93DRAFT_2170284 [Clavulina sp. PMI_390]|nr:hypothetical protein DL93DRAFT_2170284 [Clavulina sp. PMI_390]
MHASATCRHATSRPVRSVAASLLWSIPGRSSRRSTSHSQAFAATDLSNTVSLATNQTDQQEISGSIQAINEATKPLENSSAETTAFKGTSHSTNTRYYASQQPSQLPLALSTTSPASSSSRRSPISIRAVSTSANKARPPPRLPLRHASSSTSAQIQKPPLLGPDIYVQEFGRFISMTPAPENEVLEASFIRVVECGGVHKLSSGMLMKGANSLFHIARPHLGDVKGKGRAEDTTSTRETLSRVLDEVDARRQLAALSESDEQAYNLLVVHHRALAGDPMGASDDLHRIVDSLRAGVQSSLDQTHVGPQISPEVLRAAIQVVVAHSLNGDVYSILREVLTGWRIWRRHISGAYRGSDSELGAEGARLRNIVFDLLIREVKDPGAWYLRLDTTRLGSHDKSRQLVGHILIECFCARETPQHALEIYDAMQHKQIPIYPRTQAKVLRLMADFQLWPDASRVYHAFRATMQAQQKLQSSHFLDESLRYFARIGDSQSVEDVFAEMVQAGIRITEPRQSLRLHVYASLGNVSRVEHLWDEFFGDVDPGAGIHRHERVPSEAHFVSLAAAYANAGDIDGINRVLERMRPYGIKPSAWLYHEFVRVFARRDEEPRVQTILQHMRGAGVELNEAIYIQLIRMYGREKSVVAAEQVFQEAIGSGLPTQRFVLELMRAHALSASWKGVIRVFDYVQNAEQDNITTLNIHIFNHLLRAYVLVGAPHTTILEIIDRIEQSGILPNEETFLLAVQSACDARQMQLALDFFQRIEDVEHRATRRRPAEAFALTMIMGTFLKESMRDEARRTYEMMRERKIVPDAIGFGAIIRSYGNEGTEEGIKLAEDFLSALADPNADDFWRRSGGRGDVDGWMKVYEPVIARYARSGDVEQVEEIFGRLLKGMEGDTPPILILTSLLNAYRRAGDVEAMKLVWERIFDAALRQTDAQTRTLALIRSKNARYPSPSLMEQASRSSTLCVPLSSFILGLAEAAQYEEVSRVWQRVKSHGFGFDAHNWNHLAVILARAGDPVRAFQVVEQVILPCQDEVRLSRAKREAAPQSPLSFVDNRNRGSKSEKESASDRGEQLLNDIRLQRAMPIRRRDTSIALTQREAPYSFSLYDRYDRDDERFDSVNELEFSALGPKAPRSSPRPSFSTKPDIAAPLFEYHQASALWTSWAPSSLTLNTLLAVLDALSAGRIIAPMPAEAPSSQLVEVANDGDSSRAFDLYRSITEENPHTLKALRQYQRRMKRNERRVHLAKRE